MNILINLFWFFLFLPFISPFPIDTDVQPVCGALGLVLILISKRLDKITLLFAFCLISGFVFTLLHYLFYPFINPFGQLMRKGMALFLGFVTYQSVRQVRHSLTIDHLFVASSITTVFATLFIVKPSLGNQLQNSIVRITKIQLDNFFSYRGIPILASEPAFSACFIFVILLVAIFCKYKSSRYFRFKRYFVILSSVFAILSTKSGSGYLLLASLLVYTVYSKRSLLVRVLRAKITPLSLIIIVILVLPFFSGSLALNIETNRGLELITAITSNSDTISKLFSSNQSLGLRLYQFFDQLQILIMNPILGIGFQGSACLSDITSGCEDRSMISTFLYYYLAIGIIFPVTIMRLLKSSMQSYYIKLISFGFLLFSLSYAFPGPWTLLALEPKSK